MKHVVHRRFTVGEVMKRLRRNTKERPYTEHGDKTRVTDQTTEHASRHAQTPTEERKSQNHTAEPCLS